MKKCRYCGKKISGDFGFCCSECEDSYRKNIEKDEGKIKYFIVGIIAGFLIMFSGVLLNNVFTTGGGIIVTGMVVAVLPFTTSETVACLGYQKSRIMGRILGIFIIVVGVWLGFVS